MRVVVKLFALAKQRAGQGAWELELAEPATVADLRRALASACPALEPLAPNLMIAVNSEYASDDLTIEANAEVAAIPPVSGGQPASFSR